MALMLCCLGGLLAGHQADIFRLVDRTYNRIVMVLFGTRVRVLCANWRSCGAALLRLLVRVQAGRTLDTVRLIKACERFRALLGCLVAKVEVLLRGLTGRNWLLKLLLLR